MDNDALAAVGVQFEGLLIERILAPLEASLGEFGSLPLAPFAQAIAARDAHGFSAALRRFRSDGA